MAWNFPRPWGVRTNMPTKNCRSQSTITLPRERDPELGLNAERALAQLRQIPAANINEC